MDSTEELLTTTPEFDVAKIAAEIGQKQKDKVPPPYIDRKLPIEQRRELVDFLYYKIIPNEATIASIIGVARTTIVKDMKEIREEKLKNHRFSTEVIANDFYFHSITMFERLVSSAKYWQAQDVLCKMIDKLQTLGFATKVPEKYTVDLTDRRTALFEALGISKRIAETENIFNVDNARKN